ncbi:MAG: enoyl-CoA hydratase/isomerase family protein [Burkholderiaceae bacterium]|nr:enoyl-CoA hydratase/isomerase family protein [Burkholderiaceae bacterium]
MTRETVLLSFNGPVATLTLNRPETLNSISNPLVRDMRDALAEVRAAKSARALILTGAGRGFCAGAELGDALLSGDGTQSPGATLNANLRDHINPLMVELNELPIPTIAAVNGPAAGAGVGFALAADITLAAHSAYFILTFGPKLGLIPDAGSSWHLPRRIGIARAMALALLGNKLSAQQAAQWGLIWEAVADDQLSAAALQLAQTLARAPSHIALELRRATAQALSNTLEAQLDYERERQCVLVEKPTFKEGVCAFKQKRAPVFD